MIHELSPGLKWGSANCAVDWHMSAPRPAFNPDPPEKFVQPAIPTPDRYNRSAPAERA
jgi:hypothetical protein